MFPAGQPLDHEPQMGQIPMGMGPGTPPQEGWLPPHFTRGPPMPGAPYMHHGGDSPSLPMSQLLNSMPMPGNHHSDSVNMQMQGPNVMHQGPSDMDNDGQNYGEYSPMSMHKQVEVC